MFAKAATFPLFATPVWGFDLPEDQAGPLNEALLRYLDAWFSPRPALRPGETWQTTQDLHEKDVFAPLYPFLDDAVRKALSGLGVHDTDYVVTGCWANINPPGGFHPPHIHPNNLVSGVYYAQTLPGGDGISFHDPRPQSGIIRPTRGKQVQENAQDIEIEAKPGRMLLFPSWLRHSVKPNYTDAERVSLSFNIMLREYVERHSSPMWQGFDTDGNRV